MSALDRQRVIIDNRADGGVLYWVGKLYGFAALVGVALVALVGMCTYGHFARQAPPPPDLDRYAVEAPAVSRLYALDGTMLGEFATEFRELVPYEEIPEPLVQAVLAAEDHRYFEHRGIDFIGIARAAWRNVVAGDFAQGGSTITQQVAKQFVGSEKSLTRKAKEAIVARRMEARYTKEAILALYLNEIYLGGGAYGVRAAARRYYSKPLDELTLGQMATIAGMAQAPSRYSPLGNPKRAIARRNEVLDRMERYGYITAAQAEAARAEPLGIDPYDDVFGERSPYFAEHIRRYIVDTYGADALFERGLRIEATVDPTVEEAAYDVVDHGARKQDKRQGWRGPVAYLEGKAIELFSERSRERYGDEPLEPSRRYLGLVEEVDRRGARVRVGDQSYPLPLERMRWASPWSASEAVNDIDIQDPRQALEPGDVIWVSRVAEVRGEFEDWFLAGLNPRWRGPRQDRDGDDDDDEVVLQLEQVPHPQAALFAADHRTGYVATMVGGTDFDRSVYNRAIQACRQPASTYKPIYYSAALDEGYGYDTLFNDIPRAEVDDLTGEVWIPTNFGGLIETKVTLEYSLVFSKNVPSVAIFKRVGADAVEAWARRLGFTTKIIADKALALGASCTTLDELTRAFAIFARNGAWLDWVYVRRILDRDGAVVEDNTVYYDPWLRPSDRLDRVFATAGDAPRQAIPARTAYLTSKLLRQAIKFGFSSILRQTEIVAAGKTGTSSATMDTWFVAYTSRWITTVWMGDDQRVRPLGISDAAYMTVEPMWSRFMYEVARRHPNEEIPWEVPEGVSPNDRGGNEGEQAEAPMPLIWKAKSGPAAGEG